ncbi:hypothetical protein KBB96_10685 [Luteolibacter ambystomatis]|uniref:Uncharacterized protein n=1 Tax=Luteolibacter ambystomatis TaxID=2824561 RepID=A0A975IXM3_9BACT|nr:hypothetical protein [Luteolibacter ambystomatis]QUE49337.1 hypothetical protein KBB96_10685 [Luteolibacter ambystomatis]
MFRSLTITTAFLLGALPVTAQSLLKNHALDGLVKTTYWTFLASQNPYRIPDKPSTMTGTMTVASPGYGAGMGLYSWTGAYSMTVNQTATNFDIQHAVYQLDVTWDPAVTFPFNGGPVLSYNGGNQQIHATLPMILDGTKVVDNNTGVPEMENIDSFTYRGVTWQWDLSGVTDVIHSVKIHMPLANHTSVVGARIDVASDFQQVGGAPTTPLETWRQLYFQTTENSGNAADLADPDRDGVPNLMEYALGTNPTLATIDNGRSASPVPESLDGRLRIGFSIPDTPPAEITYRVKVANDLTTWSTLATKVGTGAWSWSGTGASGVAVVTASGRSSVKVSDDAMMSANPRRMMRLEVSR